MGKKKGTHTVTEEILSDLEIPLDSALMEHDSPADENEDIRETPLPRSDSTSTTERPSDDSLLSENVGPTESSTWNQWVSTNDPEMESEVGPLEELSLPPPPPIPPDSEGRDPLSSEKVVEARTESPFSSSATPFEESLSLILPILNRRRFRQIQEHIGSSPSPSYRLLVRWDETQVEQRRVFNEKAQFWLKPSHWLRLQNHVRAPDWHPDLEKSVAYTLFRFLSKMGVDCAIHSSELRRRSLESSGDSSDSPLSYEQMSRTIYGANLPDIPIESGDLPQGAKLNQGQDVSSQIALPPYFDEANKDLSQALARRMILLKAVELLGKHVTEFSYQIEDRDGQRYLSARARVWLN